LHFFQSISPVSLSVMVAVKTSLQHTDIETRLPLGIFGQCKNLNNATLSPYYRKPDKASGLALISL